MKYLYNYMFFDSVGFFKDKTIKALSCVPWLDYNTKELLGTKVNSVIIEDNTEYFSSSGKKCGDNCYEKITFKIPKEITVPENVIIRPVEPECTVYGEFMNQLSIVCDDIEVVKK